MLRRAPTSITLTAEDIAIYVDSRQAEREIEEEQKAKAESTRNRKARERSAFEVIKGDNYREFQALAAQRRVNDASVMQRDRDLGMGMRGNDEVGGNVENEGNGDDDRQAEREREERGVERVRIRVQEREGRLQRNREERLGLGGGSGR